VTQKPGRRERKAAERQAKWDNREAIQAAGVSKHLHPGETIVGCHGLVTVTTQRILETLPSGTPIRTEYWLSHIAGVENRGHSGVWILIAGQQVKLHAFRAGDEERLTALIARALQWRERVGD
jgi:hypothetical protein